ncbi:Gfo/Idh/MocA family protein [Pedococcus sp. 5OH_020]|uniref:Gfo/Idh/MocA family protein n=1 Tax=Pedococcus sp. 5OH_020 TaxID=2989814 RepID=UPI0022E9AB2E|nr:Gfo/Idh/MocA family oxidoreductase [Pedococcus sp. 5OH_020]
MAAPLRVALVGAGSMGSLHARVISGHEATVLTTVVDASPDAGKAVADRFGATWAADLDGLGDVDAVVVAAATEVHHLLGLQVLDRGLPLLMEKPLADSLAHSEDLVLRAAKSDTPLMCGLLERYNPGIVTAMQVLGEPLHITAQRHSPYVARIRTGVASDLLIHDVDIVIRMMGAEPTTVEGSLGYLHPESAEGSEDVAETMLSFDKNNAVANISASRMSQRKVRGFVVSELERLIEIDMLRNAVTIYRHVLGENTEDGLSYKQQTIIEIPQLVTNREPLAAQLDRFVALARGEVDAAEEREGILPAHRVVETVRDRARATARA